MKCHKITTFALAAMACAGAAASTTTPAHVSAAESLVSTLRAQGDAGMFTDAAGNPLNHYGAAWPSCFIQWSPLARADAQCSSFVTLLMQSSYPGWTAKGAGFISSSPNAATYHDAIEANACGFTKIANFATIQSGDFLAAKYFDNSDDSGHMMVVRGAMALSTDASGTTTWQVDVYDCSKSNHTNDSRVFTSGGVTFSTGGVGHGLMRVFTKNGAITAYAWSFASNSTIYASAVRHLTLGRLR